MPHELNDQVIVRYITGSTVLANALSAQLGISSDELIKILTSSPKWTTSKSGKWSISINNFKLTANTSADERRIDFIVK